MGIALLANNEHGHESTQNLLRHVKAEMNIGNSSFDVVNHFRITNTQLAERVKHLKASAETLTKERDELHRREKSSNKDSARLQKEMLNAKQQLESQRQEHHRELSQKQRESGTQRQELEEAQTQLRSLHELQTCLGENSQEQQELALLRVRLTSTLQTLVLTWILGQY